MYKNQTKRSKEGISYWASYADMFAALLLLFVLIIYVLIQRNIGLMNENDAFKSENENYKQYDAIIDEINAINDDIQKDLKTELAQKNIPCEITSDGAIRLSSDILFAQDSCVLSSEGKKFLDEFTPIYVKVISKEEYREYIDEIIIEGYTAPEISSTDDVHTYTAKSYNKHLNLSQLRAQEVAKYMFGTNSNLINEEDIDYLHSKLSVNGRADMIPITDSEGKIDKVASRRVEFKIKLKTEQLMTLLPTLENE